MTLYVTRWNRISYSFVNIIHFASTHIFYDWRHDHRHKIYQHRVQYSDVNMLANVFLKFLIFSAFPSSSTSGTCGFDSLDFPGDGGAELLKPLASAEEAVDWDRFGELGEDVGALTDDDRLCCLGIVWGGGFAADIIRLNNIVNYVNPVRKTCTPSYLAGFGVSVLPRASCCGLGR